MTVLNKQVAMNKLAEELGSQKDLPFFPAPLVFGEGSLVADIFFIGEAPGAKEEELLRPFVGRSGQLLTKMLESINLKREDVYISNIVKRRPPENRDPTASEIKSYLPYLKKQIEIIKPRLIITLGRLAFNCFLPEKKISQEQGKIFNINGQKLMPILHPAAALRGNKNMNDFKQSFQALKKFLEKNNLK